VTLEEALAAAVAAKPEGYRLTLMQPASAPNHWLAGIQAPDAKIPISGGYQPTPAAALEALVAALRSESES
jgi:hypothetical protein